MESSPRSYQPELNQTLAYRLNGNCYLNITNRCTLRCRFCPKFNKQWDVKSYQLRLQHEPGVEEVINAMGDIRHDKQVVFCGLGEPTLRLDEILEIASVVKSQGGKTRINTDGLINWVTGKDVTPLFENNIDSLSISLNAQNEAVYTRHCRPPENGAYPELLEFILRAKDHVEDITLTAIDGLEGVDINACEAIADRLGVNFRRRELGKVG